MLVGSAMAVNHAHVTKTFSATKLVKTSTGYKRAISNLTTMITAPTTTVTNPVAITSPTVAITTMINPDATQRTITFSGYTWNVKATSTEPWGPGPNYFSNYSSDIFVDSLGRLHMKIAQHNGKWYSTELISDQQMGYGTYRFYMDNDPNQINLNAVLGLFTWDDNTFQSDANSEVDIEFSKWGIADNNNVMSWAVQPTYSLNAFYPERRSLATFPSATPSVDSFQWAQNNVTFDCQILQNGSYTPYKAWTFDGAANPSRSGWDGVNFSDLVTVPKPSATTHAHINLWLQDLNKDSIGDAPSDGKEIEVVISKFEYIPAN